MATETLRPNAAGDTGEVFAKYPGTGEEAWEDVDDVTSDGDSSYVRCGLGTFTELYNLPSHSVGEGTINFVKVYIVAKYDTGSGATAATAIKTGGTEYDGTANSLTSSYVTYSTQYDTNPQSGVAWTWDDIDSLQIGERLYGNSSSHPRCTQVYVEVDYAAVTEKSSADSGSGADAVESLQTPQAKTSSDTGTGAEGTPLASAALTGTESGTGLEALIARLLTGAESGGAEEEADLDTQEPPRELFSSEGAEGADRLVAKIEMPTKGGGMKLWI